MRDFCGCGGLMNSGKSIFAQLMDFLPSKAFRRCVKRYKGDYKLKSFSCWDQFLCMAFAQLTYRESLRDIETCLSAQASKLHTLLDLRGAIPSFIHISHGKLHDVNVLDLLLPEPGAFYVMDRGYLDFSRLYRLDQAGSFFVTRAKRNMNARRVYSATIDRHSGLICDQRIALNNFYAARDYPAQLRRIRYRDPETAKNLVFLTNHTLLPALTICALYKSRWQVELFFKWIKQHLRIKSFFGTSENAVKTQVWIAVSVYVLVAIVRKRLGPNASLYETLQILSLTMFETTPLHQLLRLDPQCPTSLDSSSQLNLFES